MAGTCGNSNSSECCALQKFPVTVLTKSCRSSLPEYLRRRRDQPTAAPCRSSLSRYSPTAPPPIAPCRTSLSVLTKSPPPPVEPYRTSLSEYHEEPQKFPARVPMKRRRSSLSVLTNSSPPTPPPWAIQNVSVRVSRRAAEVPCQSTHEEPQKFPVSTHQELPPRWALQKFPVRVSRRSAKVPCHSTHEEPQKFPVSTHQELPPPSLSPAEVLCQSITKSCRSSLSEYSQRAPPPVASCRSSLSRYSPKAPPLCYICNRNLT